MVKNIFLILLLGVTFLSARVIDSVNIKGYKDASKLKSAIGISEGDKYSSSAVQRAKRVILHVLKSSGYPKGSVRSSVQRKGKKLAVTFKVNTGKKMIIKSVTFVGNKKIASDELSKDIVNKQKQSFSFIPGRSNGTANVDQLKYDALRVQDKYLQNGYLDVKLARPSIKVDHTTNEASITYRILREGAPYKVAKVSISIIGKASGIDNKSLLYKLSKLELKKGDVFSSKKLRTDMQTIARIVGDQGYAYAKILPRFKKNSRAKTIKVSYMIRPGSKVVIGDVTIKGNTKTKDHVVRRYIKLAPGDKFSSSALIKSQQRLARTGFFDKASIKPKRVSSKRMDLAVDVKDAKTGSLSGGAGYDSQNGFFIEGSLGEKNLLGTGIQVGASVQYSKVTKSYNLSLTDPMVMDSDYSLSAGLFRNDSDFNSTDIYKDQAYNSQNDLGGYLSVGRQFTDEIYASVGYSYRRVKMGVDSNVSAADKASMYSDYIKSSILASIVYNSTDDYYIPRHGIYAKVDVEHAGIGGASSSSYKNANFTKYSGKFALYYGLKDMINYDLIFRFKLRGNYIDKGSYVPVSERLFLGGSSLGVRGFDFASIAPTDSTGKYKIGGYRSYAATIEASIPISVEHHIRFTLFGDYGRIGESKFSITQKSIGGQVEWKSPFGPVNFIYAKAISPDKLHGDTSTFEFALHTKF